MHECDVMINLGARFDDRITGRLDAFSPYSKRIHVDIDASSINKNVKVDVADRRRLRARARGHGAPVALEPPRRSTRPALKTWWEQDRRLARPQLPRLHAVERDHQAAIRGAAPLRADEGPRRLRHDGSRPAPDVGGAVLQVRGAEPLDDARAASAPWATACRPRSATQLAHPKSARHRHRRRGLDPHEHAGDVDGRAVPRCR